MHVMCLPCTLDALSLIQRVGCRGMAQKMRLILRIGLIWYWEICMCVEPLWGLVRIPKFMVLVIDWIPVP